MLLNLAYKNVKKHWRKSFASILAISSSFVAQTVFVGYLDYVDGLFVATLESKETYGDIIIENNQRFSQEGTDNPWKFALNEGQIAKIQEWLDNHQKEVFGHNKNLIFSGVITNGKNQMVLFGRGHDLKYSKKMRGNFAWSAKYGYSLEDQKSTERSLLGVQLGRYMGCVPDKVVHLSVSTDGYPAELRPFHCTEGSVQVSVLTESEQINALDFPVGGLTDGGIRELDARLMVTDLDSAQSLLNTKKITYWTVKFAEGINVSSMIDSLNSYLKGIDPNLHAIRWQDHKSGSLYRESMGLLNVFKYFVIFVVLVITGLSVFNTSLKSVVERLKEIGALLSLGFQKSQVRKLFVLESILLVIFGNAVGALFALLITIGVNNLGIEYKAGIYSEPAGFHINFLILSYFTAGVVTFTVSGLTTYFTVKKFLTRKIIQNLNA